MNVGMLIDHGINKKIFTCMIHTVNECNNCLVDIYEYQLLESI